MLQTADHQLSLETASDQAPVEFLAGDLAGGLIILCDHARPDLPAEYGDLGLPHAELRRHIAYDIGARGVAMELANRLGAPAILTRYSRLLIDPNRGEDDPTLVMRIADGSIVPGNAGVDAGEIEHRLAAFHAPYHHAIDAAIDAAIEAGMPPALLAIHSFTPRFKGVERPWHATVLWDRDPRLALPLIEALAREDGIASGENVPYTGKLRGDTLYQHGTLRGLAHALIEIRQDLIAENDGQREWGERLARILGAIGRPEGLNEITLFGSHTTG